MSQSFMITADALCRGVASQIRNGWYGHHGAPPTDRRVDRSAL